MPVDIAVIADSAPAEAACCAEVPPASEMAGSDAIGNLQSETPAAVEATPALATDFTAQVPPAREVVAAAAVETPAASGRYLGVAGDKPSSCRCCAPNFNHSRQQFQY